MLIKKRKILSQRETDALARDAQVFNQNQANLDRQIKLDERGMAAGGYNNADIADYFNSIALSEGELINVPGGLDWSGSTEIPSMKAAMMQYRAILNSQGRVWHPTQDQALFDQYYNKMISERHLRMSKEIDKVRTAGWDEEDITTVLKVNPTFEHNMNQILDRLDPSDSWATEYTDLKPKRDRTIVDRFGEDPYTTGLTVGTGIAVGSGAWGMANATSADIIAEANTNYRNAIKGSRSELNTARQFLKDAVKTGNKDDIKIARKMVKDSQKSVKVTANDASKTRRLDIKNNTNIKRAFNSKWIKPLKNPYMRSPLTFVAAAGAEDVGEYIGGEQGGNIAQAIVGTAATVPLGRYILGRLGAAVPSLLPKLGVLAASDGVLPIGEILGLVLSAGTGISVVYDAIKDWKRHNRDSSSVQQATKWKQNLSTPLTQSGLAGTRTQD